MAGKIRNYTFYNSNLSAGQLREIKPFIAKVEKFAKFALPRMGEEIKLYCEVAAVVGESIVADLYIYGYNQMYEDQFEFERVNTKKSMADQVRGIVKAFIGGQPSVEASAYWRSRLHIAGKEKLIGPYVEVEYFGDAMDAFVDIDTELESRGVDKLVNNILEGKNVRRTLCRK